MPLTDPAPYHHLWARLRMLRAGFLDLPQAVDEETPLCQPMLHVPHPTDPVIWFLAEADGDLARSVGASRAAQFLLSAPDGMARLRGLIRAVPDRQGLERAWTPKDEQDFPGGLGDLEFLPLRLDVTAAVVWPMPAKGQAASFAFPAAAPVTLPAGSPSNF